ncbi:hypothetical protein ACQKFM_15135 [Paenibacillus xylanexedens]|uniref:hypothetical protein n=1 Tax=Paenibacillus xylanexedens TaxID=528191 RepID=UPI003D0622A4
MSMDFVVYQIATPDNLVSKESEFFEFLSTYPIQQEERELYYCITQDLTMENSIITASLSQEHSPLTDSFDDEKQLYPPGDTPAIHTFFSFDLREKFLLLQLRDYSPSNLDKDITRNRLMRILNEAFIAVYSQQINAIPTEKEYNQDELIDLFNENRVSMLRVRIGDSARLLRSNTIIFDDESLNSAWTRAWNEDESNTHEVTLKAPGRNGEGDLRRSPYAKTLLEVPTKDIEELFYWDDAGKQHKVTKNGFKRFKVNDIDLHAHPISAIGYISSQLYARRDELNEFRVLVGM